MELRQKQKEEAINRMRRMRLMSNVIQDFKKNDTIYYSERQNAIFNATLYWVSNEDSFVKAINEFEKETGALVYHCQLTHTMMGDLLSLFYVSAHEDEWLKDEEDIVNGECYVKVVNLDDDMLSDFGYIGIQSSMGGVLRTW